MRKITGRRERESEKERRTVSDIPYVSHCRCKRSTLYVLFFIFICYEQKISKLSILLHFAKYITQYDVIWRLLKKKKQTNATCRRRIAKNRSVRRRRARDKRVRTGPRCNCSRARHYRRTVQAQHVGGVHARVHKSRGRTTSDDDVPRATSYETAFPVFRRNWSCCVTRVSDCYCFRRPGYNATKNNCFRLIKVYEFIF